MSSKILVPNGPTIPRSGNFSDLTVGENCGHSSLRIYGDTYSCASVYVNALKTRPGNVVISGNTVAGLDNPSLPSDAANKAYVDSIAIGLNIKSPVQVATMSNISLNNLQTIDGYTIVPGDRVLVKYQTNQVENGIYTASAGSWTRSSDMPLGSSAARVSVNVMYGTVSGGNVYVCTNVSPGDIVGSDNILFTMFISSLIPGVALYKTGNVLNVGIDGTSIDTNFANQLEVKDQSITAQKIANSAVTNSKLQFSSVSINTGSGLLGGASLPLGSSTTLSLDSTVVRTSGSQIISGPKTFSDQIILGSGSKGISLQAPFISNNFTLTLPPDAGINGQVMATNGSGGLYWDTVIAGDVFGPASSTNNALAFFGGVTGKSISSSSIIVTSNNLSGIGQLSSTSITDGTAVLTGGTLTGISVANDPTSATTKQYVDNLLAGIRWKEPSILGTVTTVPLSGLATIDGVIPQAGQRILVMNQSLPIMNGIYVASTGAWQRASDLSTGSYAAGSVVWVEEGTVNGQTGFICTNVIGSDIVGTNPLNWLQFTGAGLVTAGAGLTKVLNVLNVNVDNSTLEIVLNNLQIKSLGITNSQIANSTIGNNKLVNNSINLIAGSGISISSSGIQLGSSSTLSLDSTVVRTSGIQNISGPKTFTDSIKIQSTTLQSVATIPYSLTLPVDAGLNGEVLATDGTGVLYWTNTVGSGNVIGPASSTNQAIARYNGVTGKLIENSVCTIDNAGSISGVLNLGVSGQTSTGTLLIGGESICGQKLLSVYDSVGLINVLDTYQTVVFDQSLINDSGYNVSSGTVVITTSGTYEIDYYLQFQTMSIQGGKNATVSAVVFHNSIAVPGSGSSCYLTEQNGSLIGPGTGKSILLAVLAGDTVSIQFARTSGTTTGQTKPGESSLIIKKLR